MEAVLQNYKKLLNIIDKAFKKKPREFLGAFLSGWQDSNLRPPGPKPGAIPGYATPRVFFRRDCKLSIFAAHRQIKSIIYR